MYKIGEFSEITKIPVKTLRYYDEIDVLKPNYVDPYSNYRLYDEDNVTDGKFVKNAQNLGCTLKEIHDYVVENGYELTFDFLNQCEERIQKNIEHGYAQLDYIEKKKDELKTLNPQKRL